VVLVTDRGAVRCAVEPSRTPRAAALFLGLATGRARWRDPATGAIVTRPMYEDRLFFRAIPGVMAQTGCPLDNGTGGPGFRIEVEPRDDDADRLLRPGALVLARYMPPPDRRDPSPPPPGHVLGSQFAVLLADMRHLAGQVTVLGSCSDLEVVARVADDVAGRGARPKLLRVRLESPDGGVD
jgi:cyclophilin family peptidyl-prolyl cis-trans isomerase